MNNKYDKSNKTQKPNKNVQQNMDVPKYATAEEHWSSFDQKGVPAAKRQYYAKELIDGITQGRYYTIEGFCTKNYLPYSSVWRKWIQTFPDIAEANELAKGMIYEIRTKLGCEKKISDRLLADLWQYSERHKSEYAWEKELSRERVNELKHEIKELYETIDKLKENQQQALCFWSPSEEQYIPIKHPGKAKEEYDKEKD